MQLTVTRRTAAWANRVRAQLSLSSEEFARAINYSVERVRQWEKGPWQALTPKAQAAIERLLAERERTPAGTDAA